MTSQGGSFLLQYLYQKRWRLAHELLRCPHGGPDRPGMAAGASEVVRLSRRTGAVLCAVHFPAGEPRTHQKEDGRAFPCREPRGTGHPAAAGQGRRTGRLDDRRAAQAGLHRGESELRLPLRHGDGQGQGLRDAAGPGKAGRLSRCGVRKRRRPHLGEDPAGRGKAARIRRHSGHL